MEIFPFMFHIWILGFLMMILFSNFTISYNDFVNPDDRSIIFTYHRFDKVKKECGSVLTSVSKLKPEDDRGTRIENELSFSNGDWEQEGGGAPLMPFDDTDMPKGYSGFGSLLKLVSFWVTDVHPVRRSENVLSISGVLYLGITRNSSLSFMPRPNGWSPEFLKRPGISALSVLFEGIYIESEENGGERVICLLGNPKKPSSEKFIDHWELLNVYGFDSTKDPSHLQADKLLLVLRYPQTFSLSSRVIRGELRSLNEKSNPSYFDKVYISSQLSHPSIYHFGSEDLASKSCNSYQYGIDMMDNMIGVSEGSEFCRIFKQLLPREFFDILPKWNRNSTDESRHNFGPFILGRKNKAMNGELFHKFALVMKDLHCETEINDKIFSTAKISAVFRAISPMEDRDTAVQRSGLGMTLSAEGIWNSSNGQLCMVGCAGLLDSETEVCNSHIQFHFPQTFSIHQRSVVVVTISSISRTDSYIPLSFGALLRSVDPWGGRFRQYGNSRLSYNFSKIELASDFRMRSETFKLENLDKKLFLRYPNLESENEVGTCLSKDLSLREKAIDMEILSVGLLLGHSCPRKTGTSLKETHLHEDAEFSKSQILNISAHLTFTRETNNISMLFLEGLYDPVVGKLYLIGCRNIHASKKSRDLEGGLDCLIEVKVEYSSKTTQWLTNPTVNISIYSQRSQDDPLYFHSICHRIVRVNHLMGNDVASRKSFEMILQVLMLSVVIICMSSQLFYIKEKVEQLPYMSVVLLGLQAFGYSLALIVETEVLFKWKASEFERTRYYYGHEQKQRYNALDFIAKLLLMIAFQLTLRLYQKVSESRSLISQLTFGEPQKIPRERLVFLIILATHMIGFFFVLSNASPRPIVSDNVLELAVGRPHNPWQWVIVLQGCLGLFQDFFLLPQIVGNFLWKIHVKPLSKVYYIGFTVTRLVLHVYNCITDSICNQQLQESVVNENSSLDFYAKFGDIAMMMTLVVFAVVVYIQQRWNYQSFARQRSSMKTC